jgi:hypothetical protein
MIDHAGAIAEMTIQHGNELRRDFLNVGLGEFLIILGR